MLALSRLIGLANGALYELVEARVESVARSFGVAFGRRVRFSWLLQPGLIRIPMVRRDQESSTRPPWRWCRRTSGARARSSTAARRARTCRCLAGSSRDPIFHCGRNPPTDGYVFGVRLRFAEAGDGGAWRSGDLWGVSLRPPRRWRARIFNYGGLASSTVLCSRCFDKTVLLAFGETLPLVDRFPSLPGRDSEVVSRDLFVYARYNLPNFDVGASS